MELKAPRSGLVNDPTRSYAVSCRRDIHIAPAQCVDRKACGNFCTDPGASSWKAIGTDPAAKSLVHRRRMERGLIIQQVHQLLAKRFRVYLTSTSITKTKSFGPLTTVLRPREALRECSGSTFLLHVAKHLELLLYRSAFSKEEYCNSATLLRRVQHFAIVMNNTPQWQLKIVMKHQVTNTVSSDRSRTGIDDLEERKKRLWLFTPSRWRKSGKLTYQKPVNTSSKQGVLINANEKCYRSMMALARARKNNRYRRSSPIIQSVLQMSLTNVKSKSTELYTQEVSPFAGLFQGRYASILVLIFSYLDGKSVIRHFTLNKYSYSILSRAITELRIGTNALISFLSTIERSSETASMPTLLPNLQHLCVFDSSLPSPPFQMSSSIDRKRKRPSAIEATSSNSAVPHTVVATSCQAQVFTTRSSGEASIVTLSRYLSQRHCPALQRLCLCSTFVNSTSQNGIFYLTEALMSGCCPQLEYLWLGGNALGDYGTMRIAQVIQMRVCPNLSFLDMRSNFIGQNGMQYLSRAISSLGHTSQLKQLCLGSNLLTPAAFQELLPCFRNGSMRQLVFLGLDRNFLTKDCVTSLAIEIVIGHCPHVKELCIGGNPALMDKDIATIFKDIADSMEGSSWGLFQAWSASSSISLARSNTLCTPSASSKRQKVVTTTSSSAAA